MIKLTKTDYNPTEITKPGDTLREMLEELQITQAELALRTGRPKKTINEIIQGKTAITPETAIQLEMVLKVSAQYWITREAKYRSWLARQTEDTRLEREIDNLHKLPINKMVEYGWIKRQKNQIQQLKEVLVFFSVASSHQIQQVEHIAFRKSHNRETNPWALAAWLRKGEIDASNMSLPEYNREQFFRALQEIRQLTLQEPRVFVPKLIKKCGEAGVYVVFTRELPNTNISGATRWITANKPLMQMSLRYKDDGHVWFTFFHEAGHIYLGHAKNELFIEDDNLTIDKYETEANNFANQLLISDDALDRFIESNNFNYKSIENFAIQNRIAPGIVVGRLQHMNKIGYSQCHKLKKKYTWENWPCPH